MTGKNYGWHKKWCMSDDGQQLQHESGLCFDIRPGAGFVDLVASGASLATFEDNETARGVQIGQRLDRLRRLTREARIWYEYSQRPKRGHPS